MPALTSSISGVALLAAVASAVNHHISSQFLGHAEPVEVVYHAKADIPLSTTMHCILVLTTQYFAIYTALAVVRTYNQIVPSTPLTGLQKVLEKTTPTVNFAPMLGVLFMATRMRALQLTMGQGNPQSYVQDCMFIASYTLVAQLALVIVESIIFSNAKASQERSGVLAAIATFGRYAFMLALYVSVGCVVYGIATMDYKNLGLNADPFNGAAPPVSPAVENTIWLTDQYFTVAILLAVVETVNRFKGQSGSNAEQVLRLAFYTVSLAPMLCILFIGARLRALAYDPEHGAPQAWAQTCFTLCSLAVNIQWVLVLVIPFLGYEVKEGDVEGDVVMTPKDPNGSKLFYNIVNGIRQLAMLALYGGFTAVIVSVLTLEAPQGVDPKPISTSMACTINLTCQFFFVYLALFVVHLARSAVAFSGWSTVIKTLESARATVQFCPMMAILFLATRMRALSITKAQGQPQGWAQQCMTASTYCLLVQLVLVLALPFVTGSAPEMDADGNVKPIVGQSTTAKAVAMTMGGLRYVLLVALYGGIAGVVTSVFTITPETANGGDRFFS